MSIASSRLFKMLIDVSCFSHVTWTGKGSKGAQKNIALNKQNSIQKVLLEALQAMDKNYSQKDLHDDIVYKILKSSSRATKK